MALSARGSLLDLDSLKNEINFRKQYESSVAIEIARRKRWKVAHPYSLLAVVASHLFSSSATAASQVRRARGRIQGSCLGLLLDVE